MKTCLHKNVYTNVHGSFIYNSPQNGNNLNVYRLMNGQTKCDASIPGNTAATQADPDPLCRILCDPVHMRHIQHANPWSKSAPRKVRSTFCKENSCLYLPITHSWLLSGLSSLRPPRLTALTSWLPTPQLFSPPCHPCCLAQQSPSSTNHSLKRSPPVPSPELVSQLHLLLLFRPINENYSSISIPSFELLLSVCFPFPNERTPPPPSTSISAHLRQIFIISPKKDLTTGFWTLPRPQNPNFDGNLRIPPLLCLQKPCLIMPGNLHNGHFLSESQHPPSSHAQMDGCRSLLIGLPDSNLPCPSPQLNFLKIQD